MDEDRMADSDGDGSSSRLSRGSDDWSYYNPYYRPKSPEAPKERPAPVLGYDIQYIEGGGAGSRGKTIDLVFIMDCTGSMQKYINSTRDHIRGISEMIRGEEGLNGPDDLRVAVVNYRDYPPQDYTYITKHHDFTSDIEEIQTYIGALYAAGGGDGPEAVTRGMADALTKLVWRKEAAKMVVLIADAPPHGIGENGDRIQTGDPEGHDPLVIARTMAQHGIVFFMVACEDTLSSYYRAVDFFTAICTMTSGVMLPLTTADLLAPTIVGSVLENMDMERLIAEIGSEVANRIKQKGETMQSVEEVARELHERLLLRNEQTKQVRLPEIYVENEITKANVQTWMNAQFLQDAVDNIQTVSERRLTDTFRKQNLSSGFTYTPGGRLPPRRSVSAAVPGAPPTPSSPLASTTLTSERTPSPEKKPFGSTSPSAAAASPGRRVISDFKPFDISSSLGRSGGFGGAAKPISVFGAPVHKPKAGPGGGMFGAVQADGTGREGFRSSARGDDEDEDDEDEEDGMFRRSQISLDQARRIATQSVFRAGRLG